MFGLLIERKQGEYGRETPDQTQHMKGELTCWRFIFMFHFTADSD